MSCLPLSEQLALLQGPFRHLLREILVQNYAHSPRQNLTQWLQMAQPMQDEHGEPCHFVGGQYYVYVLEEPEYLAGEFGKNLNETVIEVPGFDPRLFIAVVAV